MEKNKYPHMLHVEVENCGGVKVKSQGDVDS